MIRLSTFGLVAASFLVAAQAQALSLVNEDEATYTVELVYGEGDNNKDVYDLPYDHIIEDVCGGGCVIRLDNGAQQDFAGHEYVTIKDGAFVVAE